MSLGTCLPDLVARKLISQARAAELQPRYDELVQQFEARYGREAAEAMATEKVLALAEDDAAARKRTALLQAAAQGRIYRQAKHVYGGGALADGPITRKALLAHLVKDQGYGGIKNVELQQMVLLDQARRLSWDLLAHFRHDLAGRVRHKADLRDLARALHGETIDDLNITEMAKAVQQTFEWLRSRFNAAGGRIGQLEGWGLPHTHDAYRVGSLTAEEWIDRVAPALDRARMIDFDTGLPLSDAKLRDVLREAYDSITSQGANKAVAGQPGERAWSNRFADHRVLHFRDADAWFAYNEEFGTGTVFDAINAHFERMSKAIGAMEVLGPNPPATIRWMRDMADIEAKTTGTAADRAAASVADYEIEKVWDELTGANRRAVRPNVALFMAGVRHYQVATRLGYSVISALSDHATRFITNTMNGLPVTAEMGRYFKQVNPLDPKVREWARMNLIVSDELAGRMGQVGRMHIDDTYGGPLKPSRWDRRSVLQANYEFARRLSDFTLRATGLTPHTIASREAGAYQFVANLTYHSRDAWPALDGDFRAMLERHGIGPEAWETIRQTQQTEWRGKGWLLPDNIADVALREQVMRAMMMEVNLGTPTSGAYQRALMRTGRPGTVMGEGVAGAVQFKMFPVVVVAEHAQRMMQVPAISGRAKYAAAFFGSTLAMGYLSAALYELAHGRAPDMTTPDFFRKAALRSGGLGVYGDALNLSRNEFGQSLSDLTAGPQLTSAQNIAGVGWAAGDMGKAAAFGDDEAQAKARLGGAKALRNMLRREVPALNSWMTGLAYERLLVDTLFEMAAGDPQAVQRSYRATERYAEQAGSQYYAPPGSRLDWSAPDLGHMAGEDGGEQAAPDFTLPQ